MSKRLEELKERHALLLMQCDVQRVQFGAALDQVEAHLGGVDRAIDIGRRILQRPLLLAGGLAVIAFAGRKRLVRWIGRGALLLSMARRVRALLP
ncbi:MAG: hypothetical protein DIU71_04820 [Proteobacteria bacterium]|nr:MAG: hypothetical protein DIU71_04820 [Pseudomonadota bacterium]